MRNISYASLFITLMIISLLMNITFADEIDFSDETLAKEIIEGSWLCNFSDKWGYGETPWEFEKVSGKKVTGKSHFAYCPSKWAVVKGKLKKNKMKVQVIRPKPCSNLNGVITFTEIDSDDGLHKAEGKLTHNLPTRDKATIQCVKTSTDNFKLLEE